MATVRIIRPHLLKAARVLLVFALVFYTSLRVEYFVAYGSDFDLVVADDGMSHAEDTLTDLAVYQRGASSDEWIPVPNARATSTERSEIELTAASGEQQFVIVPVWNGELPIGYEQKTPVTTITSAQFAEWEPLGGDVDTLSSDIVAGKNILLLTPAKDGEANVKCKLKDGRGEDLSISFYVKVSGFESGSPGSGEGDGGNTGEAGGGGSEPEEVAKLVSVDILNSQGQEFPYDQERGLEFARSELPLDYQLQAKVLVENQSYSESGEYRSPENGSFSAFSGGVMGDLEWSVTADPSVATIDKNGLLHVAGEGEFTVTCVARVNATTEEMPAVLTVVAGSAEQVEEDPQGPSHPQSSLHVVSNVEFPKAEVISGEIGNGFDDESDSKSSGGSVSGTGADEGEADIRDGGVLAQAEDGSTANPNDEETEFGAGTDTEADNEEGDEVGSKPETVKIDQTYSVEDIKALGLSTSTFNMNVAGNRTRITGEGVAFKQLIEDAFTQAGADLSASTIESVDFIDYLGKSVNIPYSFLESSAVLVAVRSYVHVAASETAMGASANDQRQPGVSQDTTQGGIDADEGGGSDAAHAGTDSSDSSSDNVKDNVGDSDEGDQASSGTPSAQEPLDNTCFRVLFESTSSSFDADSLRWINTIQLNGKTAEAEEDDLIVHIDYTPVPIGVDAEFVAVPSFDITGSWNCVWEISNDEGITSEVISGENGQTLRIPTNDSTLHTWYRVTIDNEASSSAEEHLKGTSEWVELTTLDGWGVVLSYNPPRAGDLAIFRTSVYGFDGDISKLEYVWEWSDNGGITWNTINGETKPTLTIPTDPVSEDEESAGEGEGDDSTPVSLIYIRVRVVTPENEKYDPAFRVSNVQPLTVYVGDEDTDTGDSDSSDGREDGEDRPVGGNTNPPSNPAPPAAGTIDEAPVVRVTEIEDITKEYSPTPTQALDPNAATPAPAAPQTQGAPVEIFVNDSVSEAILEQQEAAEEYQNATTPGARWTSLNTVNPTGDEVRRVLDGNPLAPLVVPFSLGITVAGGLEKLLMFRRQL